MGMRELGSGGCVLALSWERGRGQPRGPEHAGGGSHQALGPLLTSPGLSAGSWLSGVHTRMLLECCRTPASNVLCVLMDKININLHFFFFPLFLFI